MSILVDRCIRIDSLIATNDAESVYNGGGSPQLRNGGGGNF